MKEEITKAYESLAPVVRDVIDNSNWEDQLTIILKKNNLRIDQVSVIENNTVLVMLGLMPVADFILSLKEDAEITNQTTIDAIMTDIETAIFAKIREALIQSTTMNAGQSVPTPTKVPVAAVAESREDILKQIEDPIETVTILPSPVTPAVAPATETVPKAPAVAVIAPTKSIDPYREPIE